jgi:hypothetical protein
MNRAMKPLALLLLAAATAAAQYTIDWRTMDGGGGSGAAGTYAIQGTLGQPDTATGATGSIAFTGGYWSLLAEPLPVLRIFLDGPDIVLAWPDPSPGFQLQASPDLAPASWADVLAEPEIVDTEKQVVWGPPVDRHFFRLHRP